MILFCQEHLSLGLKPGNGEYMNSVKIKGMSCQHCVASVKQALEKIDGISDVSVDLDKGEANFQGEVAGAEITSAISAIGFEVVDD